MEDTSDGENVIDQRESDDSGGSDDHYVLNEFGYLVYCDENLNEDKDGCKEEEEEEGKGYYETSTTMRVEDCAIPSTNNKHVDEWVLRTSLPHTNAPDGGFGWVVAAATVLLMGTLAGLPLCFGLVLVRLRDEVTLSHGMTSVALALVPAFLELRHILGPVCTRLGEVYGPRKLSILGQSSIAVGLTMTSLSQHHIVLLLIGYGCFVGIGVALSSPQSAVVTKQYFTSKRALVTAITNTGATICSIATPILLYLSFEELTLKGGVLLWSASIVQSIVGCALMQPVHLHSKIITQKTSEYDLESLKPQIPSNENESRSVKENCSGNEISTNCKININCMVCFTELAIPNQNCSTPQHSYTKLERSWSNPGVDPPSSPIKIGLSRVKSTGSEKSTALPIIFEESDSDFDSIRSLNSLEEIRFRQCQMPSPSRLSRISVESGRASQMSNDRTSGAASYKTGRESFRISVDSYRSVAGESVYYSLEALPLSETSSLTSIKNKCGRNSLKEQLQRKVDSLAVVSETIRDVLTLFRAHTIDLCSNNYELFTSNTFILSCLSSSIINMSRSCMDSYLPLRAAETSSSTSLLVPSVLMTLVIAELCFKYLAAIVSSQRQRMILPLHIAGHLLTAVASCGTALAHDATALLVCTALYGAGEGVVLSTSAMVMIQTLPGEWLNRAPNVMLLSGGLVSCIGVTLLGVMYAATRSAPAVLLITAGITLVPAALWSLTCLGRPNMTDVDKKNLGNQQSEDEDGV